MTLPPIKLGSLTLSTNLMLAPIAGYTDLAFRKVARSCGAVGLATTEIIASAALVRRTPKSLRIAASADDDRPLSTQLYSGSAELLCEAARWAEDNGAQVIDINMGCPVDKVTKLDGGSKLLCDPEKTVRMVEQVMGVLKHTPLTCKLRLGWDASCIVAPRLAKMLEDAGVQMITIHGRTAAMMFSGKADLGGIADVVAAVKRIPVIGNGDIRTPDDAKRMIEQTGCAGVMIGRGALSGPWIFPQTWTYLTTGIIPPPPPLEERVRLMCEHFRLMVELRGERYAIQEFRKRISWWAKQLVPCRRLREQVRLMKCPADFDVAVEKFLEWRAGGRDEESEAVEAPEAALGAHAEG